MKRLLFLAGFALLTWTACQKDPAPAPELIVTTPSSIDLPAGGSGTISFTTNQDWTVSSSESWVHVSPASGKASDGPVTISVTSDPNTTYDDRTATVTIKAGDLSKTVTVKQPAKQGLIVSGAAARDLKADDELSSPEIGLPKLNNK